MKIRKANKADADICAQLIYSAAPEKYDYWLGAFGDDPIMLLTTAFQQNAGVLGYRYYWVVEDAQQMVVAGGAFYTHKQANKAIPSLLLWLCKTYGSKKMPTLIKRALQLADLQKPLPNDLLYVGNVAVIERMRGRGIATQLLNHQYQIAEQLGLNFALDVAATNTKAQNLYRHLGFVEEYKKQFTGCPAAGISAAIRMVKV